MKMAIRMLFTKSQPFSSGICMIILIVGSQVSARAMFRKHILFIATLFPLACMVELKSK